MELNQSGRINPQETQAINDLRYFISALEPDFLKALPLFQSNSNHSIQVLYSCWSNVRYLQEGNIPGDIVEFGVWKGGTLAVCVHAVSRFPSKIDRHIWGFDTFEGYPMPRDDEFDIHGHSMLERWNKHRTGIPWGFVELEGVQSYLDGISPLKVELIKRNISDDFFPKNHGVKEISFLRLDMNWYQPTKIALTKCWPLLVTGGVLQIVVGHHSGAKAAFDEFLSTMNLAQHPNLKRENLFIQRVNYSTLNILKGPCLGV